jgi:hypothetical protein
MTNIPCKQSFFDGLIDLNNRLWDGWATLCFIPLKAHVLTSICFGQITDWNALINRCFQFHLNTVLPSAEKVLTQVQTLNEASVETILAEFNQVDQNSLPCHTEFDTLIYPWHEAEDQSITDLEQPSIYSKVA